MAPADDRAGQPRSLGITVAYSPAPGQVDQCVLSLPTGSTAGDALNASGLLQRHPQARGLPVGVWGRKQALDAPLHDGDRVEIYRPLLCDPKESRRLRYRQKAEKTAAASAAPKAPAPPLPPDPDTGA